MNIMLPYISAPGDRETRGSIAGQPASSPEPGQDAWDVSVTAICNHGNPRLENN